VLTSVRNQPDGLSLRRWPAADAEGTSSAAATADSPRWLEKKEKGKGERREVGVHHRFAKSDPTHAQKKTRKPHQS